GGGGGGAAAIAQHVTILNTVGAIVYDTGSGSTPTANTTIDTVLNSDLKVYNGSAGKTGTASATATQWLTSCKASASGGSGGTHGKNFRDSRLVSGWNTTGSAIDITNGAKLYADGLSRTKDSNNLNGQITITLLETTETKNDAEKLFGLEASGTISKYFDIKSVDLKTAFSYTSKNSVTNDDGSITVTYLKNSTPIAKVTYLLTTNADGSTNWKAYRTEYSPTAIYTPAIKDGVSGSYITHSSSIDFVLTLSPKEGFLGGNDVPLIHYGTNGADDTGLCIEQQGAILWFPKRDSADYVNVAINYKFNDNYLTTDNATITCGESVNQANLIYSKIPLPTGADAWKGDFVKVVHPATKTVSPTTTTTYDFTQQVVPKEDAKKAVILDSVSGVSYTKSATVYVNYSVTTSLSNITYKGPTTIASGEGLSAVLETNSGYLLPSSISISVGGTTLSSGNYTYNSQTGDITIAASKINGNIVITANAKILTYGIYYNYQDPVTGEQVIVKETGHGGEWAAGATINPADLVKYNELNSGVTNRVGYNFAWEWGTTDGSPITVMPAGDLYIVGLYEPIVYTVTIHYADENGNTLANDFVGKYYYQDKYSVISPQVAGYLANQTVTSGTLGAENVEITVTYAKTSGQLNIIYVYGDSQTIAKEPYTQSIVVGEEYAVLSPEYVGYTADKPIVSGTVTGAQAESGITIYVTYTPKNYVVSFDAAGGTLQDGDNTKTVAYNNIYGFDPTKPYGEQYYALPTPIRTGYEFIGWQDENGNLITEDTKVILSKNHTLTAKWQGQLFTLTVNYYYSEVGGELAAEKFVTRVEYGTEYNFPSPYIEGYTPAPDVIGVMGAGSRVIDVVYTIDAHSITIHYVGPNGEQMANDYTAVQDYNTNYSVTSPTISGYTADQTVVSGTVGIEDIDITVNYEYIDYTLTINYLIDDETLKPETVVVEGLHIKDTYSYPSPEIIGYTASRSVVSGTVGTSNVTVNVSYSRNSYVLKINYVYGSDILDETLIGTTASPSVSYSLNYGAEYNYASPVIKGYFATLDSVSGVMPANNVEITVHYNQALFVSVEWGNLTFDYNQATWDADSHGYNIPPVTDGSNYITITNSSNSSTNVDAELKYTANEGFESISGYFTRDDDNTKSNNPTCNITVGQSVKYWLWLIGTMPDELDFEKDMQTTGVCTVTIGGAD
ncbi:MAG: MucBP domain-containing protein, partial [Clostridia bacterium]|nr:MucBP domain-containing protein [Clostridia bacterium]